MTHPLHVAALTSLNPAQPARTQAAEDAYFSSHAGNFSVSLAGTTRAVQSVLSLMATMQVKPLARHVAATGRL